MNTIQIQLNDRQLADLTELLDEGLDAVSAKLSNEEADHYTQADRDEIMRLSCDGISEIRQAIEDRSYLWTSGSGSIELEISSAIVDDIAVSGDNEPVCRSAIDEDGYLRRQLEELDMEEARDHLKDAGIDEVDEKSDEMVRIYTLWMACHDIAEERHQED